MVESAFDFADICREQDYHNFLFSMKASNPLVMVQVRAALVQGLGFRAHAARGARPQGLQLRAAVGATHARAPGAPARALGVPGRRRRRPGALREV